MEPTAWTDPRLDDAFAQLREEMRDLRREMHAEFRSVRGEMAQIKFAILGGYAAIVASLIATNA